MRLCWACPPSLSASSKVYFPGLLLPAAMLSLLLYAPDTCPSRGLCPAFPSLVPLSPKIVLATVLTSNTWMFAQMSTLLRRFFFATLFKITYPIPQPFRFCLLHDTLKKFARANNRYLIHICEMKQMHSLISMILKSVFCMGDSRPGQKFYFILGKCFLL